MRSGRPDTSPSRLRHGTAEVVRNPGDGLERGREDNRKVKSNEIHPQPAAPVRLPESDSQKMQVRRRSRVNRHAFCIIPSSAKLSEIQITQTKVLGRDCVQPKPPSEEGGREIEGPLTQSLHVVSVCDRYCNGCFHMGKKLHLLPDSIAGQACAPPL